MSNEWCISRDSRLFRFVQGLGTYSQIRFCSAAESRGACREARSCSVVESRGAHREARYSLVVCRESTKTQNKIIPVCGFHWRMNTDTGGPGYRWLEIQRFNMHNTHTRAHTTMLCTLSTTFGWMYYYCRVWWRMAWWSRMVVEAALCTAGCDNVVR